MIGRLQGEIAEVGLDGSVLVAVGGVGYEVHVPVGALGRLREGEEATLYVHTHAREDALMLYGFASAEDKSAFRILLGVNGVGPRLAMAILGVLDAHELAAAVAREDRAALKGIPGVGKKTVERILLDLKDKLLVFGQGPGAPRPAVAKPAATPTGPVAQVVAALVGMGYKPAQAERAVEGIDAEGKKVEALLREALSALA